MADVPIPRSPKREINEAPNIRATISELLNAKIPIPPSARASPISRVNHKADQSKIIPIIAIEIAATAPKNSVSPLGIPKGNFCNGLIWRWVFEKIRQVNP